MPLVALSELDAVNTMLISIGQAPVNTLAVSGIRDVAIASTVLHNTSREVQNLGWDFNQDYQYELVPNGSNHIILPANALNVEASAYGQRYAARGDEGVMKFWDLKEQTFEITVSPLKVNIIWFFDFADLPQHARNYIATKAARRFQAYSVGSQILFEYTMADELDALTEMKRHSAASQDVNILSDGDWTNQIFARRRGVNRF